jgi:putative oxidoreductase
MAASGFDPANPQRDPMDQLKTYSPLIARLLIGGFFLLAGVGKVGDIAGTAGYIQSVGLPGFLAWPSAIFEIVLGLALIVGYQTRIAALAGAAFCVVTAVLFHNNLADQTQMVMFLKNFSIAGAFLMFFANGAGKLAIDKA